MRSFIVPAAAATLAAASTALAGFTVTTGLDPVSTPDGALPGPQVGDTFATTTPGTFAAYLPDTPLDPQISGGDLNRYRYTLSGAITAVNLALGAVQYAGDYTIFYDGNLDNSEATPGQDFRVSTGTFLINALFAPLSNDAVLTGQLTQTSGPAIPAFRDLSYGGSPVEIAGTYFGTSPGVSGFIQGTLRQNAIVPTPGAAALLGIGAVGAIRRRRAR